MKLIYFYLKNCCGIEFNLDVNFSENKLIKVTKNRELKITDIICNVPTHFYGDNIINVSAIVGRNGAGKSSILNLLGLKRLDLHSCYPDSQWIAIYENENTYFLEGFNVNKILDFEKTSTAPYIGYKLNRIKDSLHFDSFIQYTNDIQNKYCVIHKPDFSNSINNSTNKNINDNDDRNYGFKRNYLHTNMANFYEFVTYNKGNFCSHLNKKHISLEILESPNEQNENKFKFYNQLDRYLESNIFNSRENKVEKLKDAKQLFVINFIEEYIISVVNNVFDGKNLVACQNIIAFNSYMGDLLDYDNVKIFLLNSLEEILEELRKNDDELLSYLGEIDWDDIINFFESEERLTFTKVKNGLKDNITCYIHLEKYSEKVHSFILNLGEASAPIKLKMPRMSSGEFDINSKLAGINKAIKLTIESNSEVNGFIILLDEYDEHLHPEWSRIFLDYLLKYLCQSYKKYNFQVILSTHSPYIISDLLKENVIKLEHDTSNGNYVSSKANRSFASNIYDIINDSFFLSQPIGKFAERKINNILSEISKINVHCDSDYYTSIRNLINVIDDDYIKKTLLTQLDYNYRLDEKSELKRLEKEIEDLKDKKRKILKEMDEKKYD